MLITPETVPGPSRERRGLFAIPAKSDLAINGPPRKPTRAAKKDPEQGRRQLDEGDRHHSHCKGYVREADQAGQLRYGDHGLRHDDREGEDGHYMWRCIYSKR